MVLPCGPQCTKFRKSFPNADSEDALAACGRFKLMLSQLSLYATSLNKSPDQQQEKTQWQSLATQ
jgi:hypothetical protein